MQHPSDQVTLGTAHAGEIDTLAGIAAICQPDPERHCPHLGDDPSTMVDDITDVAGWADATTVARIGDRVAAWLLADVDAELGRVWWSGPWVEDPAQWDQLADALYASGAASLPPGPPDGWFEEFAGDARSSKFAGLAARLGFDAEEGSACLNVDPDAFTGSVTTDGRPVDVDGVEVVPLGPGTAPAVAALHDRLFPGTHTSGDQLVRRDEPRLQRWAAVEHGDVVGYVATERQNDGSLYVDFLGVEPDQGGRGIGRALIGHACRAGFDDGATHAHLTVRESNVGARRLYERLGFRTERVIVPYRRRPAPR